MEPVDAKSINKPDIAIFDAIFVFTDENQQPFRNANIDFYVRT